MLAIELQGLIDLNYEIDVTGFSQAEIDLVLERALESSPAANDASAVADGRDDVWPEPLGSPITSMGDLWQLGRHKLVCGNARIAETYSRLLGSERVDLVFTDPPYNVPIDGHVSGLGAVKHREFAFASGEMSSSQFIGFLTESLGAMASRCRDGAIASVCMDWRHMRELLAAG